MFPLRMVGPIVALLAWCAVPGIATGQVTDSSASAQTVTTVPGPEYGAGWLHRVFFGDHYRDLWTTEIEVATLDLGRFAGGLTPLRRGGGRQTRSLRLQGGDGQQYVFRSIDKDPSGALPPSLRETLVEEIVQDQISAALPSGALVVAPLLEAAGVLHAAPRMVVMPNDPALGEFRAEFAGMLGTIEVRPTEGDDDVAGFAGADRVVGSEELFERLERGPNDRVDSRAFLAARLLDVYLGDWDRHQDQWRWARFGDGPFTWQPIPRDRDQALSRLDGVLLWLARFNQPQLVGFAEDYPPIRNATWNARDLDRRLLVDLEREVWDSVAGALQERLTDDVIRTAVARMPAAHQRLRGASLSRALMRRRDGLRREALAFYALLARHVDVHATDADELVEVTRGEGGQVTVTVSASDPTGRPVPYYRRRFSRRETEEIRLYLHGGADRAIVRGTSAQSITVRVIGGGGNDTLIDSSRVRGATRFYDDRGDNTFVTGPGTVVDRRNPNPRPVAEDFAPPPPAGLSPPPPDWGHVLLPVPWTYFDPDIGFFAGAGITYRKFGFRQLPYQYALRFRVGYATAERAFRADAGFEVPDVFRGVRGALEARGSGIEVIRFHGYGNEREAPLPEPFYKVRQQQLILRPSLTIPNAGAVQVVVGPVLKVVDTDLEPGTLLDSLRPYGIATFSEVGGEIAVQVDTRDRLGAPSRGVLAGVRATVYPSLLSVDSTFVRVGGHVATYLSPDIPADPTLALRVAGEKIWGQFPFFEAAYVGGDGTVRGFRENRFAGDGALYGNAELRLALGKVMFLLPGDIGIFGLADVGRVFLAGESSDTWHASAGGGVWLALLDRANTLSIGVARGSEGTGVYVRAGFLF